MHKVAALEAEVHHSLGQEQRRYNFKLRSLFLNLKVIYNAIVLMSGSMGENKFEREEPTT